MKKPLTIQDLDNLGSLITLKEHPERCLGDLFFADQHGCFDPTYGRVPVTKEQADAHNLALDQARLKELDENCKVGQGDLAYCFSTNVTTFSGTVINDGPIQVHGKVITFTRKGKTFRGRMNKNGVVNYKRIA